MSAYSLTPGLAPIAARSVEHDTWGIGGHAFLAGYTVLALAALVFVYLRRRRLRSPAADTTTGAIRLESCELAMLNGGEDLAVATAVTNLRTQQLLEEADGDGEDERFVPVDPDGDLPSFVVTRSKETDLPPLEREVYRHLRENPHATMGALAWTPGPLVALGALRAQLSADGLLLDERRRERIRLEAAWIGAAMAFGVTRIIAGIENQKPVGLLVIMVAALGVATAAWALRAPLTTLRGAAVLASARTRSGRLDQTVTTTQDPRLGLALALFGAGVLWGAEPALASALDLPRPGGGGGDGGGGGCGGGCGGCGG
jgi:uncharacterized protein (TIGR04222 family)